MLEIVTITVSARTNILRVTQGSDSSAKAGNQGQWVKTALDDMDKEDAPTVPFIGCFCSPEEPNGIPKCHRKMHGNAEWWSHWQGLLQAQPSSTGDPAEIQGLVWQAKAGAKEHLGQSYWRPSISWELPSSSITCTEQTYFIPTTWKNSKPSCFRDVSAINYQGLERHFLWREAIPSFPLMASCRFLATLHGAGHWRTLAPHWPMPSVHSPGRTAHLLAQCSYTAFINCI